MPITLNTPIVNPSPSLGYVHLERLEITLELTPYAKTAIRARVRLYSIDGEGNKVFSSETRNIAIEDAEATATALAGNGDLRGVEADQALRNLVALLVDIGSDLGPASAD